MANELNELQAQKHINSSTVLLLFLLLSDGVGFRYFAQMEPHIHSKQTMTLDNYVLNFFVITFTIFGIGIVDYLWQMLISFRDPPDYINFQDLCSVANISVLMFNDSYRGYYVHGKSPTGSADLSSENLCLALEQE